MEHCAAMAVISASDGTWEACTLPCAASMASVGLVPGLLELLWWHAMREALPIKPANAAAGGSSFAGVRQKCLEVVSKNIPDTI